ncbi:uncharacterized protein LOC115705726 isoform X1 [Cannabis sativa]|uniref:uncharacterized protein LOC115705726 isoform X1 n=1 Tax=Cannabis sativa TaxID=3483 RepID=UPI0029C9F6A5|nr:uncharacterized protein LOC115705726 isoform X1 [Cannabis sativa]XP_030488999.2 uncharacterized protein LOC115705726 isoform X1 [Cannabis sativa]XP_060963623.1 uncharacterized protein LOC115705726 isoform X1 [Cannabis sativa]
MAGSVRFESTSASPEDLGFTGSYSNVQRGGYLNASLDRSGSFRESGETRMFSSGASTPRASTALIGDLPPIAQYLTIDPITIENQRYTRLGELRRALGIISFGSTGEDNSFGAAHSKPAPSVATEELKRFKANVQDGSNKAKIRKKMLEESLQKLNKYCDIVSSKKQRNEMITTERSVGLNLLKMGSPSSRNPAEPANQKLEERTKNVILNKRVRSSVAEIRAEGQTNNLAKRSIIGKDRDMLRDCGEGSHIVDEKIRRLPVGGETWDRKIKRKRSVGPLLGRPLDDGEPKRAMHHKLNNDQGSTSCDAQIFRPGPLNGINKFDGASLCASSNGRAIFKNELDKVSLSRDSIPGLSKERLKGNIKLNGREDNQILGLTKGKASRAQRSGPVVSGNLSPNFPRTSGSLEGWEQAGNVNKTHSVSGANNRNRPIPTGSSSPPMAWVGQRPQKISRTRRSNLVSPVSNHDEVPASPEACSPSDLGTRLTFSATNGSLGRSICNAALQYKPKHDNMSSPSRLSESEDSGAACENRESRFKEKGAVSSEVEDGGVKAFQNTVPSTLLTKKSKITIKEGTGDSVRRQGRSGRGSSFPRINISPVKEKLENLASAKPIKSSRHNSERSGSKSGRPPLKKFSERKAIARLGHTSATCSPDCAGEQDDDREELLAAASFACNASNLACSGPFWKKMQPIFAPVNLEEISYLKEQLNFMEVTYERLSQIFDLRNNVMNYHVREENLESQVHVSEGKERSSPDQVLGMDTVGEKLNLESKNMPPLYQRVLSALIMEDEMEEFEEECGARVACFQQKDEFSPDAGSNQGIVGFEFEGQSIFSPQTLQQCAVDLLSCNGSGNVAKSISTSVHNQLLRNNVLTGDHEVTHLDNGSFTEFSEEVIGRPPSLYANASGVSPLDCSYEKMRIEDKLLLELQSVGIYPEIVPDLAEGDDEAITSDILGLQKHLFEQVGKTKVQLKAIIEALEGGKEEEKRGLEQVAMEKLVESSYKKLLATRGSLATKLGVAKVPKQVAVGFMKRTLARCRRLEDTGKSCFSEPALQDVILAVPPHENDPEVVSRLGSTTKLPHETRNSQLEPRLSGSLSDWAEQYDPHNKVDNNSSNLFGGLTASEKDFAKTGAIVNRGKKKEVLLDDVGGIPSLKVKSNFGNNLLGGVKGKRSERERDKDTSARNSVPKAGRLSLGNSERKTKTKPKQKTAQLSTSGNGLISSMHPSAAFGEIPGNGGNRKSETGLMQHGNSADEQLIEKRDPVDFMNLQLHELDPIELGVVNELGGHQDLSTWLNIEEDGLQEHDAMGLDIPMDDLSELNMIL